MPIASSQRLWGILRYATASVYLQASAVYLNLLLGSENEYELTQI